MSQRARVLTVLAVAVTFGGVLLVYANVGAAAVTASHSSAAPHQAPAVSDAGRPFRGTRAAGALFTMSAGKLGTHFCTASVVHSAKGDLAVTAAHCVTGTPGQIAFVPGYANGKEPHGVWKVTAVYTDKAWQSSQNPNDDVAFLRLSDAAGGVPVERVTGAESVGIGWKLPALVQVIGYPETSNQPISCVNWAKRFSPTQLVFDCDGYTDGTSGGPFLADVSAASGRGTLIGVIGGYEQGGDTPQVSYASAFGTAVAALYRSAEAGG
jgi:V8-like Glu-specific endopeptidase